MPNPPLADLPYPQACANVRQCAREMQAVSISDLLANEDSRQANFTACAAGWHLDFSRHQLDYASWQSLQSLAAEAGLPQAREALFTGEKINHTEDRAVLHTLLRSSRPEPSLQKEWQAVQDCLRRMEDWVLRVHSGSHLGYSGERITDVVNLGIGGSDLGPRMVAQALTPGSDDGLRTHFVANVDPAELNNCLATLDPARTLFIICSKTLRTEETLYNAQTARAWLQGSGASETAVASHFLAVSTNLEAAREFGIPAENILPLWDWVGGRYSLWSGIGWSIAFAVGMDGFRQLLAGAQAMDEHFRHSPCADNLPIILSLLEIWYCNFLGAANHAVIPYDHNLRRLPAFLQQLSMESNGKRTDQDGEPVSYTTAPTLWGDEGSNGQHSFHQLLHQGTPLCPVDFILPLQGGPGDDDEGHQRLVANCLSQGQALMSGRNLEQSRQSLVARGYPEERAEVLAPHLVIPGNRPSSTLSCQQMSPFALGALLSLYEHKTFCSGYIWRINSFDQWGVELGKELGGKIFQAMQDGDFESFDASTLALLQRWKDVR